MNTLVRRDHRPARVVVVVLVALLAALLVPQAPALANSSMEAEFVQRLNQERTSRGLAALSVKSDLTDIARRHSVRMADQNHLHHNPNLRNEVTNWRKIAENVGYGPTVKAIHDALMKSDGHRRNILDPDFTDLGMGVEVRDGVVWVTQVFRQPKTATSQPSPSPSPKPSPSPPPSPKPSPSPSPSPKPSPSPSPTAAPRPPAPAPSPTAAPSPTPEPAPTAEALPPVRPEVDRTLVVMTRVAAMERHVDAMPAD